MGQQFIYTMIGVRKVHPPDREVIKDISLSFFFGAKIGVLGHNGAGKSTLLRIMAGLDTEFIGEAKAAAGIKIGFLEQEPQLDPDKTVVEHVEMAVAETRGLLTRFEEIGEREQKMLGAFDVYIDYIKDPKDKELVMMKFLKARIYWRHNHFDEAIPLFVDIIHNYTGYSVLELLHGHASFDSECNYCVCYSSSDIRT